MRRQSSERGKNLSSRAAKDIYERANLSRFIGDRNEPRNIVSVLKQIRRPARRQLGMRVSHVLVNPRPGDNSRRRRAQT